MRLFVVGDMWMVQETDPVRLAEVRSLFGVDMLPTPYRFDTPADVVKRRLESLNPGATVTVVSQ